MNPTYCADALVFVWTKVRGIADRHQRWVLLGERDPADSPGWAIPGGRREQGEDALTTAVRELREETGLYLPADIEVDTTTAAAAVGSWVIGNERLEFNPGVWVVGNERLVPDPRPGRWITNVCSIDLGLPEQLPQVLGLDGTRRADWFRAGSFDQLTRDLRQRYGGRLYEAHIGILIEYVNAEWKRLADGDRT